MSKPEEHTQQNILPEEVAEQSKEMIQEGMNLFKQHAMKLAEEAARFNARQKEAQQRVRNAGTRTSGRII